MEEVKPLGGWECADHEAIVWASRLDDRYLIEVVRATPGAKLRVFDRSEDYKVLLDEQVPLAFGAVFGPDVDDVADWQERVISVIDGSV